MQQNTNETKYKWNKMQKYQNTNTPKYKRNSILGDPIENQCIKGGGLLYGGCILVFLHFVLFVFCSICSLLHLYLGNLYFVLLYFVVFVFWNFCILSCCILFRWVVFCSVSIMEHLYFDTDSFLSDIIFHNRFFPKHFNTRLGCFYVTALLS